MNVKRTRKGGRLLGPPVRDISVKRGMRLDGLAREMAGSGGFVAKKTGEAVDLLEAMVRDRGCLKFLSFPACIIATGCRGVIRTLVKERLIDVIVTTCGTLDHDLARSWATYHHGDFDVDDVELHRAGIHRIGNVFVPMKNYGIVLEEKIQPVLNELWRMGKRSISTRELAWELGRRAGRDSILRWAWRKKVPVYIPGIFDGAVGSQLWLFWQTHREFGINEFEDQQELADLVFGAKRSGALIIGGGISKHHVIWWNQFKGGLDYAVYITTAPEWDGSLSGARTREAISWGKIRERARHITVEGDATLLLPVMTGALLERL
ncbi:MAG: deoxyhypusine synthase [Candidatus Hadarchaeales archaeon]